MRPSLTDLTGIFQLQRLMLEFHGLEFPSLRRYFVLLAWPSTSRTQARTKHYAIQHLSPVLSRPEQCPDNNVTLCFTFIPHTAKRVSPMEMLNNLSPGVPPSTKASSFVFQWSELPRQVLYDLRRCVFEGYCMQPETQVNVIRSVRLHIYIVIY